MTRGETKRDGERPERLRIFAALDIPGIAIDSIAAWQGQALAGQQRLRPIDPGNLHLTLAFLGDRDPAEVERAAAALTALDASGPVRLRLLPDPVGLPRRRPRVIAFDVESDAAAALQHDLAERLREAGLPCGVMAMPILPWLSDSDEALDSLFGSLAAAGATGVTAGALYLKPGTREWFMQWIAREHPQLAGKYRRLYGTGSYASPEYRIWLSGRIRYFKARHGFSGSQGFSHRDLNDDPGSSDPRDEEAQYPAGSIPEAAALRGGERAASDAAQPTLF